MLGEDDVGDMLREGKIVSLGDVLSARVADHGLSSCH